MKWYRDIVLGVILAVYICLGLVYSLAVPLAEAPDELDHFRYVEHLVVTGSLPVMSPVAAENFTMEANQPPLYYWLQTAVTRPIGFALSTDLPTNACYTFDPDRSDRAHFYLHDWQEAFPYQSSFLAFHLARAFSILLGAGTVIVAYLLAGCLLPGDPIVGRLAAGLLAFNPQFIFIHASVNNDVLMALLGGAILLAALAAVWHDGGWPWLALGVLMGLGLLTKYALLAFWPLALAAAVVGVVRKRLAAGNGAWPWRRLVTAVSLVTGLPLLIAGWWYVRANRLYGDPLVWDVHLAAKGSEVLRSEPLTVGDLLAFVRIHFQSYWGWFGWLKIQMPGWVYSGILLLVLVGLVGLIRLGWRQGRLAAASSQNWRWLWHHQLWVWLLTVGGVTAVYVSLLRYILTINWSGYQGRLAYAATAPLAVLLAVGLRQWLSGRWAPALPVVSLAMLSFAVVPLLLWPAYPRPQLYAPDPALPRICGQYEGGLLEAFAAEETAVAGSAFEVTLFGYGVQAGTEPLQAFAQLVLPDGTVVAEASAPWRWAERVVAETDLRLQLPSDLAPAGLWLQAGLRDDDGAWLLPIAENGDGLPPLHTLARMKVPPTAQPVGTSMIRVDTAFGESLRLLGLDLLPIDGGIQAVLYWQAQARPAADLTTFVHVVATDGALLAQDDSPPVNGRYPTSVWAAGEIVADTKTLQLPDGIRPAALVIGLYDSQTVTRLPALAADGQTPLADGVVRLPWAEIQP